MKNNLNGILFDLEGTLIATRYQKNHSLVDRLHQETKEYLSKQGIPSHILCKSDKSILLRNLAYEWAINNLDNKELNNLKKNIEKFMLSYDLASTYSTTLYRDTIPILTELLRCDYKVGIVTNTSKRSTNHMLNKHKITKYFDTIITRNDVIFSKPNPEMLFLAIKKMNRNVKYLVGDSIVDAEAAKKASIKSIIIKRENEKPEYFHNHLVTSLNQIKFII